MSLADGLGDLIDVDEYRTDYPNLGVPYLFTTDPVTPLPQGSPWGHKAEKAEKRSNPCASFHTLEFDLVKLTHMQSVSCVVFDMSDDNTYTVSQNVSRI